MTPDFEQVPMFHSNLYKHLCIHVSFQLANIGTLWQMANGTSICNSPFYRLNAQNG